MRKSTAILASLLIITGCTNPAEDAVRGALADPESAEFREVTRCKGDAAVWRGEVNARNRMGGFTGYKPFFYDGVTVAFLSDIEKFSAQMDRCYSDQNSDDNENPVAASAISDSSANSGSWIILEDTNPLDDTKTTVATLLAEKGRSRFDGAFKFSARCRSNKTEVYVAWYDYLGDDSRSVYSDWKYVDVRVGEEKAEKQRWSISSDSKATFAPNAIKLLRKMAKEERLVLQTTPYNESPRTAIFDLTGAENAIGRIAADCNWAL